jgi:hypothetical protein
LPDESSNRDRGDRRAAAAQALLAKEQERSRFVDAALRRFRDLA